jgi:hypothetical protein
MQWPRKMAQPPSFPACLKNMSPKECKTMLALMDYVWQAGAAKAMEELNRRATKQRDPKQSKELQVKKRKRDSDDPSPPKRVASDSSGQPDDQSDEEDEGLTGDYVTMLTLVTSIHDMFVAEPSLKTAFEFIRDWVFNSAAGTIAAFWGPSYKQSANDHPYYWGIGIHLGILLDILDVFRKVLDTPYKGVDLEAVTKCISTLIQTVTNTNDIIKREHEDILSNVNRDKQKVLARFFLPVSKDLKDKNILYLRINTFWNIMAVLGGKPRPWPLTTSQLAQMHERALSTKNRRQAHGKGDVVLELFRPLDLETFEVIQKSYSPLLRRLRAQWLMLTSLMQRSRVASKMLDTGPENSWRSDCILVKGQNLIGDTHWLSTKPILSRKKVSATFALNKDQSSHAISRRREHGPSSSPAVITNSAPCPKQTEPSQCEAPSVQAAESPAIPVSDGRLAVQESVSDSDDDCADIVFNYHARHQQDDDDSDTTEMLDVFQ